MVAGWELMRATAGEMTRKEAVKFRQGPCPSNRRAATLLPLRRKDVTSCSIPPGHGV